MERLTIDGGELWLGFARNRVKALRQSGLAYTRQAFDMPDGARVIIELAGKDHTIRLSGADKTLIISGVVREGKIVELPVSQGDPPNTPPKKVLRSFRATANAAKKALKKPDMAKSFGDIPATTTNGSQANTAPASAYTGIIKKVVQTLLGLTTQVEIKYTFRFEDTYGVYRALDGSFWLLRISKKLGVLAMLLGLLKTKPSKKASTADQECYKLLKGIPTGEDFPQDLDKAITDKKVLRLASADDIKAFYELKPYYDECGWSFNAGGSEAHNTGHKVEVYEGIRGNFGCSYTYHYKIDIEIKTFPDQDKPPEGKATLHKVSSHFLHFPRGIQIDTISNNDEIVFGSEYDMNYSYEFPTAPNTAKPVNTSATIYVCHSDEGVLSTIGYIRLDYTRSITGGYYLGGNKAVITVDGQEIYTAFEYRQPGAGYVIHNAKLVDTVPQTTYPTDYGSYTLGAATSTWSITFVHKVYTREGIRSTPTGGKPMMMYDRLYKLKHHRGIYLLVSYKSATERFRTNNIGYVVNGSGWEDLESPITSGYKYEYSGRTRTIVTQEGTFTEVDPPYSRDEVGAAGIPWWLAQETVPNVPDIYKNLAFMGYPFYDKPAPQEASMGVTPASISAYCNNDELKRVVELMSPNLINEYSPVLGDINLAINSFGNEVGWIQMKAKFVSQQEYYVGFWGGDNAPTEKLTSNDFEVIKHAFIGYID